MDSKSTNDIEPELQIKLKLAKNYLYKVSLFLSPVSFT